MITIIGCGGSGRANPIEKLFFWKLCRDKTHGCGDLVAVFIEGSRQLISGSSFIHSYHSFAFCFFTLICRQGDKSQYKRHAKQAGPIGYRSGSDPGQKYVILSVLKGFVSISCRSGQVNLYFSHEFFFLKKIKCICYLESHAINYLM